MKSSIFPAAAICKPYIRLSLDSIPKCTKGKEANIVQPINLFKLALIDTWQKNYCMLFKFQCFFWVLTPCNLFAHHCLHSIWICCQLLPGNGFIFKYGGRRNFFLNSVSVCSLTDSEDDCNCKSQNTQAFKFHSHKKLSHYPCQYPCHHTSFEQTNWILAVA